MAHRPPTCRSCGAEVHFARNIVTGARLILDPEPHPDGTVRINPDNTRVCKPLKQDAQRQARERGLALHRDHHATCPRAHDWRNRNRTNAPT